MTEEKIEEQIKKETLTPVELPGRKYFHLGRRLFHFVNAFVLASLYALFLDHKQLVYILGAMVSVLYILEQIRLNYPDLRDKLAWTFEVFLRAEERLKESAAIPYVMGILLTVLSFPKIVALISVYTLAIGDPLSALVGIKFGKHRIFQGKSLEGSLAFLLSAFACAFFVLALSAGEFHWTMMAASLIIASGSTIFEMLPIRLDDNLTIPLFTGLCSWIVLSAFGLFL